MRNLLVCIALLSSLGLYRESLPSPPPIILLSPESPPSVIEKAKGPFDRFIDSAAEEHELDPLLIRAVIVVESRFNPKAGSHKGAVGLMQLMPNTALEMGVQDRLNPEDNIRGGSKYLKKMIKMFKGDIKLALAAYNAGPGNVLKYKGIPPFKESTQYVAKVLTAHKILVKEQS